MGTSGKWATHLEAFSVSQGRASALAETDSQCLQGLHVSSASQKLTNFSQKTTVWSCPFPILSSLLTSFTLVGEHQGPTSEFRVCLRKFSATVVEGVSDRDCKPSAALASQGAPNRASPALGRIPARSSLATRRQQPRHFPLPLEACEQRAHLATPTLHSQSSQQYIFSQVSGFGLYVLLLSSVQGIPRGSLILP